MTQPITVLDLVYLGIVLLAGLFVQSFVAEYLKKKGENLATREDVQNVVKQIQAVTTVQEEIKAQIAEGLWDRQKRWELKKEVLFEVCRKLTAVYDAILELESERMLEKARPQPTRRPSFVEAGTRCNKATSDFAEVKFLAEAVCGKDATAAIQGAILLSTNTMGKMYRDDTYVLDQEELRKKFTDVTTAIRKELKTDDKEK